jgi:hypothetical protein
MRYDRRGGYRADENEPLIRSQKQPAFNLFRGIPPCLEPIPPARTVSRCPIVTQGV